MTGSSGDLLADRRYAYAEAAFGEADYAVAADLARQAIELAPDFAAAWFLLGQACAEQYDAAGRAPDALGLFHDATRAFEQALAADPEDRLGAGLRLARLGIGDPLAAMAPGYVRALFDEYAIRFDRHLVRSLKYRAPDLLHGAVRRACSLTRRPFGFGLALDLGCGTGLAGEAVRPICAVLEGIDLSPAMVERARRKTIYDALATGDLVAWLADRPAGAAGTTGAAGTAGAADLILAADVLVYLGDLAPVFAAVARVLRPTGLFAFTVQAPEAGEAAVLGDDLRFAHGEPYLRALAKAHGLGVSILEPVSTREDRGRPVPGILAVMSRP